MNIKSIAAGLKEVKFSKGDLVNSSLLVEHYMQSNNLNIKLYDNNNFSINRFSYDIIDKNIIKFDFYGYEIIGNYSILLYDNNFYRQGNPNIDIKQLICDQIKENLRIETGDENAIELYYNDELIDMCWL